MPDWTSVRREHVLAALNEYDRLGAERFLHEHGFGSSRGYVLRYDSKTHDSKAILGAAHRYSTGRAVGSAEFSGGKTGAAKVLRELGFEVTDPAAGAPAASGRADAEVETCPTCHLAVPRSGICDNCD